MNSILVQDIFNGKFNDEGTLAVAYGDYGGVWDEDLDYIDSVGVGDDSNIYFANCYEELVSMLQNDSFIIFSVDGVSITKVLIEALKFLSIVGRVEETAKVYVKDDKGYVVPVKQIIEDEDANKIVFCNRGLSCIKHLLNLLKIQSII